jgi:hypothetical protein
MSVPFDLKLWRVFAKTLFGKVVRAPNNLLLENILLFAKSALTKSLNLFFCFFDANAPPQNMYRSLSPRKLVMNHRIWHLILKK